MLPRAAGVAFALLAAAALRGQMTFTDVTAQAGITFVHTDGSSGKHYIVEYVCCGLALLDYDGDGDDDIYFLNGAPLGPAAMDPAPRDELWRNDGGFRFADATAAVRLGDTGHGLGVVAGDYDNDGHVDLYINNFGPNVLYRNEGNGTFSDVTAAAGVGNGSRVGAGACFLDMDGDGDLDLYVANYIKFSYGAHVSRMRLGCPVYPSPRDYPPDPDVLFRNNGDGTFTDASKECGIGAAAGPGMGMICADYDGDGDTDIFVANDVHANFLLRNDGKGVFEETGLAAGIAYDFGGLEHGNMGVECADYDNDGRLDFYVTSYQQELAVLYRNLGDGFFEDVTIASGAGEGTRRHVTWGNGLIDFDNDGDRDIFVACGHLDDTVDAFDDTAVYNAPNQLLENLGNGRFANVSARAGSGLAVVLSSRGAGFADLDLDGDMDIVVLNSRRGPTILRNDTANGNHWVQIRLRGMRANRDGVGSRVKVTAGDLVQIDEVHSGRGYQGHWGLRLHFGLGARRRIDRIEVAWLGGGKDVIENVEPDRFLLIREGSGAVEVERPGGER